MLCREIRGRRDEIVALAADLVRIPTVNPPGDCYEDCARLIGERLARRGFTIEYLRAEGERADSDRYPRTNIVARREGGSPGPCIHFNGHIDVVEPGEGWTRDPFDPVIEDGKLYGRGTCDMKGGLAAAIVAAEVLVDLWPDHPGAVEISGTVDEESGGYAGVAWLAGKGYFSRPRVDHVIIPEPLNKNCVCLGHRGVWWAEIETRGRVAHGSMPFLGRSAIRDMAAFMARVEEDLYPRLDARRTVMPVIPEGARASTLNFNSLHGGQAEGFDGLPSPMVADRCRLVLDRRFLIEEKLEDVRGEVVELLEEMKQVRPGFDYGLREMMSVEPTMTEKDAPVVRALDAAIAEVLGEDSRHVVSPGTYDQKHVSRIGHLQDCVAYGPGILDLAHQPDEYIGIDDMTDSAVIMLRASAGLLKGNH
jgi:succinyl-diaminopimelate desuccinylase